MESIITAELKSLVLSALHQYIDKEDEDIESGITEGIYEESKENAKTLETNKDLRALVDNFASESPRFPNGFTSWQETHFEVVAFLQSERNSDQDSEINRTQFAQGTGGLYELAEAWTDEFENLNVGRAWDGEFFDEIEQFCKKKNIPGAGEKVGDVYECEIPDEDPQIDPVDYDQRESFKEEQDNLRSLK